MSQIEGLENARQVVGPFEWHHLNTIRRLCWEANDDPSSGCHVQLSLDALDRNPQFSVTVRFDGVQRLKVADFTCPEMRITGLYIDDISERQWERLRWEIGDFENGELHFLCESIRVISATLIRDTLG